MPLNLILGRVGCGKTAHIADEISARIDRTGGTEPITVLVPDQYTVASENFFIDRLGEKRSRTVTVSSLKSLARNLFARRGVPAQYIGEGGKTMLLKKAFDAVSPSFRYYPQGYRDPRLLHRMLGAFKELKAAGISADQLMDAAKKADNGKLYDIAMLRQVYEGFLSEGYFDPEDALERLSRVLAETGEFENEAIYVTNFRSFYNRERKVLLQLLKNGADLTVTLPTDTPDPLKAGLLRDAALEAEKLIGACRKAGEPFRITNLQPKASFEHPEFKLLEAELARPSGKISRQKPEHMHLFCGADRFDEAEQAAAVIAAKVRDEGYRYRDFTVIVRSLEDYAGILDPIFDQYEIPLFYHRRTPLRQRNPIPLISGLFSLALEGYSQDTVLSVAKSGFLAEPEDAAWFERYVFTWNLRYNRFLSPFRRPMSGFDREETEEETAARTRAEQIRKTITETVEGLKKECGEGTVREISAGVWKMLEDLKVPETLDRNAEEYREYGEYELAARQRQVYEQLLEALDEMVLTAGDDRVTLNEYRELFLAVVDTHDLAILPTSLDEVTAGSPETLPMTSPRCVFVLGLNEGVFPQAVNDNRILTDADREILDEYALGETTDDKIGHELYYFYSAMTAPREELYLSYAAVVGGEASPCSELERIREIFPELSAERFRISDPASAAQRIQREQAAFSLHTKTPVEELKAYFSSSRYADLLNRRTEQSRLSEELCRSIYPDRLFISATRANCWHQCKYAYFFRYGMGIYPMRKAELDALHIGTIIHEALEKCLSEGIPEQDEALHEQVRNFERLQLEKFYGNEAPPETVQTYFSALSGKIEKLLKVFRKEFAATQFRPVAFEQKIGSGEGATPPIEIPLERGTLSMIGTVDRVDLYEKDGIKYLKVVDYKSGTKTFSFDKIRRGIDVQMLMYLYALRQNYAPGEAVEAAGVQYVGANPKIASAHRGETEETIRTKWETQLQRSGVFLNDPDILRAADQSEGQKYLNLKANSDYLITQEKFGELFEEIGTLLQEMGNSLHRGETDKNPTKFRAAGGNYCSCDHCDLSATCRKPPFRERITGEREEEPNRKEDPAHAELDRTAKGSN